MMVQDEEASQFDESILAENMDRQVVDDANQPDGLIMTNSSESSSHSEADRRDSVQNFDSQSLSQPSSYLASASQSSSCSVTAMRSGNVDFVIPGIKTVSSSQGRCMICGNKSGRKRISIEARLDVWIKRKLFVPAGNRTCIDHLSNGKFKDEALSSIKPERSAALMTGNVVSSWIHTLTDLFAKPRKLLDFNDSAQLTNEDYRALTGVCKEDFEVLLEHCKAALKSSKNR
jgi:hypothetical protein